MLLFQYDYLHGVFSYHTLFLNSLFFYISEFICDWYRASIIVTVFEIIRLNWAGGMQKTMDEYRIMIRSDE